MNIYVLAFMRDVFGWGGVLGYLAVSVVAISGALLVHRLLERPLRLLVARRLDRGAAS